MKIIPVLTPETRFYFVDEKFNLAESEALGEHARAFTSALRFNQGIPFTSLARHETLVNQEILGEDWVVDPSSARLEAVAFKLWGVDRTVVSNVGQNVEDARFMPADQHDFHLLKIDNKRIPFVISTTEVASTMATEDKQPGTLWAEILQHDLHVCMELCISAALNIKDGNLTVLDTSRVHVRSVLDRKGQVLDPAIHPIARQLEEYCVNLEPLGYWVEADWLTEYPKSKYPFDMGEACPLGRALALLSLGVLSAYTVIGYAADITEPTESSYGLTELYLEPQAGKAIRKVQIEEGFSLLPGWMNVEFFGLMEDGIKYQSLGRYEKIPPVFVGQWGGAVGMFLVNGDTHVVNLHLPALVPDKTTWVEIEQNPDEFAERVTGEFLFKHPE
jgi:hypothetical protein